MTQYPARGIKSSEFWMSVVAAGTLVANDGLGLALPTESIMSLAALAITYVLGRSAVKAKVKN